MRARVTGPAQEPTVSRVQRVPATAARDDLVDMASAPFRRPWRISHQHVLSAALAPAHLAPEHFKDTRAPLYGPLAQPASFDGVPGFRLGKGEATTDRHSSRRFSRCLDSL